ncbi:MAG TPA: hypothetical protein VF516_04400, partial [Kofleriaceae bacterium]
MRDRNCDDLLRLRGQRAVCEHLLRERPERGIRIGCELVPRDGSSRARNWIMASLTVGSEPEARRVALGITRPCSPPG